MTLIGLIPARGGSKRVPRKNIKNFSGKPLIQWTIEAALNSSLLDRVIVSTDDSEIAHLSAHLGAEVPFIRPDDYASDYASGMDPVFHALDILSEVSEILLLQPTSPLRSTNDINAIIKLRRDLNCESIVSVTPSSEHPSWMYQLSEKNKLTPLMFPKNSVRLDLSLPVYRLNGALYYATRQFLLENRTFVSSQTVAYKMPQERSIDIDTPLDWRIAEFLASTNTL